MKDLIFCYNPIITYTTLLTVTANALSAFYQNKVMKSDSAGSFRSDSGLNLGDPADFTLWGRPSISNAHVTGSTQLIIRESEKYVESAVDKTLGSNGTNLRSSLEEEQFNLMDNLPGMYIRRKKKLLRCSIIFSTNIAPFLLRFFGRLIFEA